MTEKIALADGRADAAALLAACRDAARRLVAFDMEALADATGSALSAVLFGALAGSGALPFPRTAFEAAIRRGQVGVNSSLAAFGAGFEAARAGDDAVRPPSATTSAMRLRDRANCCAGGTRFPGDARRSSPPAIERLQRLSGRTTTPATSWRGSSASRTSSGNTATAPAGCWRKPRASSRSAMAYEDTIRVADLKIRASRFARVRDEAQVADGQILEIAEFFHPRTQEIADTLPAGAGRWLMRTPLGPRPARSRDPQGQDHQDHVGRRLPRCFTRCRSSSRCGAARCASPRNRLRSRTGSISWRRPRARDYALALQVARMRSLVKGYGDTHERGRAKFDRLAALVPRLRGQDNSGTRLEGLIKAALAEEGDDALDKAIAALDGASGVGTDDAGMSQSSGGRRRDGRS